MFSHSKIDEAISEVENDIKNWSIEFNRELELEIKRIRAAFEEKYRIENMRLLKTLDLLKQAKANLNGNDADVKPLDNEDNKNTSDNAVESTNISNTINEESSYTSLNYEDFPVREEVRKIIGNSSNEFSPKIVKELLDRKFPRILDFIHESSAHKALNDLVKSGEMVKVGIGKYRRKV